MPISIIWENYFSDDIKKSEKSDRYLLGLRIITTIFTFLVAAAVPHLGLFISLFGAFCLSILGLAFPAIMVIFDLTHPLSISYIIKCLFLKEICVLYPDKYGPLNWHLWKDLALVIFAFAGLTSGTYASMKDIIATFSNTATQ